MRQTWKLLSGVACSVLLALTVMPVEAAVTKAFVSISPQRYFVQKIGGDLVDVSVLVPAGASPHNFEPKPRQMAELSKSAVYFAVGIDFEKIWLKRIAAANPRMRVVRTDDGIAKIPMADHHDGEKSRRPHPQELKTEIPAKDHYGGVSPDPHVWLSPALVKIQAGHIRDALVAMDPAHRSQYESNYASFMREIDELDAELKALFAGRQGEQFMVFHPSWGYFAEAYGLVQVPVEIEGKEPKPAQLQKLIRHARERHIKVVFVQPQFSAKSAELLSREIGGQIVYTDPLAENWAANLREVARKFKAAAR
ncbi:MAG: zinc ABC transporter substrate-binding protein [Deltaproteobacteria bacterium]|nr:zinc ABC transporter substrate-binding protein [Deltaproteobacteria bacterium]